MKAQAYLDMMKRQQQELTDFPIAYAFNEKQLEEALEKLGATKEECCTYLNMGDVTKKTDVPAFKAMLKRHTEELQNAIHSNDYLMKYNDSYFRIGLVDITYGVLDEGEKINVYFNGKNRPITIENDLGIGIVLPIRVEVKGDKYESETEI